ncbi:MAG: hypothetical protein SGJ05_07775 [bacterium]|nr:hypothetical protein [bacterium]
MKRVDTSNAEVQLVLKAWVDSLAVWRQSALGLGTARDRSGLAGMPDGVVRNWFGQSAEVVATFPPTVLSIEPIEQGWEIRTLFSATDLLSRHIVPLGILRSAFVRDDKGTWTVESPLLRTTSDWEETRTDRIRYVHPANLKVNKSRAKAASDFVASTAATFGIEPPTRITFYVTNSRDAMSTLLGIEYYSYPPSGLSYPAENIILSGMGDAWYPHELVHIVFRDFDDAHPVVREGVATWLGGSLGEDFSVLLTRYIREKKPTEIPSFVQLFTDPYLPQDDVYIVGAALCKAMYNKAGAKAILELLRSKSTSDAMISITRVLGIEPGDRQETLVPLLTQLLEQSAVDAGR